MGKPSKAEMKAIQDKVQEIKGRQPSTDDDDQGPAQQQDRKTVIVSDL